MEALHLLLQVKNLTPLQVSCMTQTPGTPAYMPPEMMVANPKYDTSVDDVLLWHYDDPHVQW